MTYKYGMMDTVLPVSRYSSSITVIPEGANISVVVWKGKFKRADSSSTPAVGKDDKTAIKTITDIYRSGLANLKKISE
jgi:mxaD protein